MATGKHRGLLLGLGIWDVAGGEGLGGGGWAWAIAVVVWGVLCSLGSLTPTFLGARRPGWVLPLWQWDQRRKTVGSKPHHPPLSHTFLAQEPRRDSEPA